MSGNYPGEQENLRQHGSDGDDIMIINRTWPLSKRLLGRVERDGFVFEPRDENERPARQNAVNNEPAGEGEMVEILAGEDETKNDEQMNNSRCEEDALSAHYCTEDVPERNGPEEQNSGSVKNLSKYASPVELLNEVKHQSSFSSNQSEKSETYMYYGTLGNLIEAHIALKRETKNLHFSSEESHHNQIDHVLDALRWDKQQPPYDGTPNVKGFDKELLLSACSQKSEMPKLSNKCGKEVGEVTRNLQKDKCILSPKFSSSLCLQEKSGRSISSYTSDVLMINLEQLPLEISKDDANNEVLLSKTSKLSDEAGEKLEQDAVSSNEKAKQLHHNHNANVSDKSILEKNQPPCDGTSNVDNFDEELMLTADSQESDVLKLSKENEKKIGQVATSLQKYECVSSPKFSLFSCLQQKSDGSYSSDVLDDSMLNGKQLSREKSKNNADEEMLFSKTSKLSNESEGKLESEANISQEMKEESNYNNQDVLDESILDEDLPPCDETLNVEEFDEEMLLSADSQESDMLNLSNECEKQFGQAATIFREDDRVSSPTLSPSLFLQQKSNLDCGLNVLNDSMFDGKQHPREISKDDADNEMLLLKNSYMSDEAEAKLQLEGNQKKTNVALSPEVCSSSSSQNGEPQKNNQNPTNLNDSTLSTNQLSCDRNLNDLNKKLMLSPSPNESDKLMFSYQCGAETKPESTTVGHRTIRPLSPNLFSLPSLNQEFSQHLRLDVSADQVPSKREFTCDEMIKENDKKECSLAADSFESGTLPHGTVHKLDNLIENKHQKTEDMQEPLEEALKTSMEDDPALRCDFPRAAAEELNMVLNDEFVETGKTIEATSVMPSTEIVVDYDMNDDLYFPETDEKLQEDTILSESRQFSPEKSVVPMLTALEMIKVAYCSRETTPEHESRATSPVTSSPPLTENDAIHRNSHCSDLSELNATQLLDERSQNDVSANSQTSGYSSALKRPNKFDNNEEAPDVKRASSAWIKHIQLSTKRSCIALFKSMEVVVKHNDGFNDFQEYVCAYQSVNGCDFKIRTRKLGLSYLVETKNKDHHFAICLRNK